MAIKSYVFFLKVRFFYFVDFKLGFFMYKDKYVRKKSYKDDIKENCLILYFDKINKHFWFLYKPKIRS